MEGMSRGEVRSTLLLMALAGGLANVSVGALNAFFVVSAVESGLEAKVVGTLLAAASIAGITIRLLGGWLLDKTRASPFPAVAALMAIGTVGVALLATGKPSFIVVGVFAAFGGVWGWAGMLQYGIVLISPEAPASASGVVLSGLASGMAIGPVLFGVMAGSLGYSAAWVVAAASAGIAALLMTLVARTGRRHLVLVSGVTTVTG